MKIFCDVHISGNSGRIRDALTFEFTFVGDEFTFECLDIPEKKNILEMCKMIKRVALRDTKRIPKPERTIGEIIGSLIQARNKKKVGFKKVAGSENGFTFIVGRTCRVLNVADQAKLIEFLGIVGSHDTESKMISCRTKRVNIDGRDVFICGMSTLVLKAMPGYKTTSGNDIWQHRIKIQD